MNPFVVILLMGVIALAVYVYAHWLAEMIALANKTEREEKLERRNAKLRRERAQLEQENAALKYQLAHPSLQFKTIGRW